MHYHNVLLSLPNVTITQCTVLKPATLLPTETDGEPKDRLSAIAEVCNWFNSNTFTKCWCDSVCWWFQQKRPTYTWNTSWLCCCYRSESESESWHIRIWQNLAGCQDISAQAAELFALTTHHSPAFWEKRRETADMHLEMFMILAHCGKSGCF